MDLSTRHVMLIDDDPDIHDVIRLILTPLQCRVTCHLTGPAGLAAMRAVRPDLLLLDIMLATPREGLVLANQIRADEGLREIPIVMISSIGQSIGEEYARELGASSAPVEAFLEKPLDPKRLLEEVQRLLTAAPE